MRIRVFHCLRADAVKEENVPRNKLGPGRRFYQLRRKTALAFDGQHVHPQTVSEIQFLKTFSRPGGCFFHLHPELAGAKIIGLNPFGKPGAFRIGRDVRIGCRQPAPGKKHIGDRQE